jgi:hypothetical protein
MDRIQLLKKIEKAWQDLKSSYQHLPESKLLEPGVTGTWSIKDIIAHVTSWEEEALKHLPHILAGERPPKYSVVYGGIDAFNDLTIDQTRELPLPEVLARRDETHKRLIDYLQGIPEEQIATETRFRRRWRLDSYGHYPKHSEAIVHWEGA